MSDGARRELLAMRGIVKRFAGVPACDGVDLTLHDGDVLGLLGENGAGKTTLMNVLFGTYAADAGSIRVAGQPVHIRHSADALRLGIGMVHQHFHLVARHSVLENLMVGRPGRGLLLDRAGAAARLAEIGRQFRLSLPSDAVVGDLTIGEQQRLEIIKALFRGTRILILDEPTAALTPAETAGLFDAVRAMAGQGMGVILISHKLGEVRAVTSRIMVMRQGRRIDERANDATVSEALLAQLMCGHAIVPARRPPQAPGRPLLRLSGISTAGSERRRLKDLALEVRAGEIVGVAGIAGNGQRELADVIAGMLAPLAGTIEIDGRSVARLDPRRAQALGIGRIPEDRMATGLLTQSPLAHSMALPRIRQAPFSRLGLLDRQAIRRFAEEQIAKFAIRAAPRHSASGESRRIASPPGCSPGRRWPTAWCCRASARRRSAAAACSTAAPSAALPKPRSRGSPSAPPVRWCGPARCRAATCRRRCWRASWPGTRWWCSPPSRPAASTSAPPSSCTTPSWRCAPPVAACW